MDANEHSHTMANCEIEISIDKILYTCAGILVRIHSKIEFYSNFLIIKLFELESLFTLIDSHPLFCLVFSVSWLSFDSIHFSYLNQLLPLHIKRKFRFSHVVFAITQPVSTPKITTNKAIHYYL